MTRVYNASDSISTRPKISAKRMPAWAPGLRAEASQAEAAEFALSKAAESGSDTHGQISGRQVPVVAAATGSRGLRER